MSDYPVTLEGAFTALITPFDGHSIDHDAYTELVDRQIEGGIDGLVPCGTTGEAATMSKDEMLSVIRTCADAADGRVPVVAGTGSNDTRKTIETTRAASEISGVDAALVVTPYYNKPDQEGMYRHFIEVADNGGLPVVLYNVPSRTGVSLTAETVARLAKHDNIIGIKEASADMTLVTRIADDAGDKLQLMSGDDFTTYPLVSIGGTGCISVVSNLDPATMSELVEAADTGDVERARELHQKIQPLGRMLFAKPNPVPTKVAASLLGWCEPDVRPPLYLPSEDFADLMEDMLEDYGLL
jgi:4-hydroxy-tetrahydrodipicolinate synthase